MSIIDAFRPKDIYDKVLIQRELDGIAFYTSYSKEFVKVNCPACHMEGLFAFKKWGFNHKKCPSCNTLYNSPRPVEALLLEYYNNFKAPNMWTEMLLNTDVERKRLQNKPRVELILSMMQINDNAIAVDIGAGSGAFCLALQDTGKFHEVIASEIADEGIEACKNKGLVTFKGTVADMPAEYAYLITMNDLIEHLFDPSSFLSDCHRVLQSGGYLSIATPNGEGFDFKLLGGNTKNITPPEHINYFNPYSIQLMLKSIGFTDIQVTTPGILDVDIIKREIQEEFSLLANNEWLQYLYTQPDETLNNFQRFLSDNKLSSHMLIVARKK